MMGDVDWASRLRSCLDSTHYCAIATSGPNGPWVNPVFFSRDEGYSLLFVSLLTSRHMVNIGADPRVAIAVFSTAQQPGDDVLGVQLAGMATVVPDDDVPAACARYFARPGAAVAMGMEHPDPADFLGDDPRTWRFVRISPTELFLFDSRHFGDERVVVPDAVWR